MLQINRIIRNKRLELGLSQVQLAYEAHVSLPTIQSIEAGKANLSQSTLMQILEALGLKLQIHSPPIPWEQAPKFGVPLTGNEKAETLSRKELIDALNNFLHYLPLKKEEMIKETRSWEAFTAFLWAIETHYPKTLKKLAYNKKAKFLLNQNLAIFEPGRLIKLRRIALANISGVL